MKFRNKFVCFSQVVNLLVRATLLSGLIIQVECLDFNFSSFTEVSRGDLIMTKNTNIQEAIQVTKERCSWSLYNNGIVNWVRELYKSERIIDAIDIRLSGDFEEEQAECVLKLALACCHPNPYQRPSMKTTLQALAGEAAPPPIPNEKPAFMWPPMDLSFKEDLDYSLAEGQVTPITVLSGR